MIQGLLEIFIALASHWVQQTQRTERLNVSFSSMS